MIKLKVSDNKQLKNNNELLLFIIYLKGFCHVVVRTSCRCLYRTSGIINQLHYGATCAKMQKKSLNLKILIFNNSFFKL